MKTTVEQKLTSLSFVRSTTCKRPEQSEIQAALEKANKISLTVTGRMVMPEIYTR